MDGFKGTPSRMRVSRDDCYLVIVTRDSILSVWSIEKQACIKEIKLEKPLGSDLYFTLDNKYLLVSGFDMNGGAIFFFALNGFYLITSITSSKQINSFTLIDDEKYLAIGEDMHICIKPNPLKNNKFSIVGPETEYPIKYMNYLSSLSQGIHEEYLPEMDKFAILPCFINALHFYAYYNLTSHLEKSLENNGSILTSTSLLDIMIISLSKGYSDNIKVILNHVIHALPENPYAACFLENSIIELNRESCQELSQLYEAIFFISKDKSLPRFSLNTSAFYKSTHLEIYPATLIKGENSGKSIQFYQSALRINTEIGSQGSIDFLDSILNTGNDEIFRSYFISTLLNKKWSEIWSLAVIIASFYLGYLVILSLYTLDQSNDYYVIIIIIQNVLLILYELYQVRLSGFEYFTSIWNILDIFRIALFLLYYCINGEYNILLLFLTFFSWIKGVSFFRIFSSTRYMVTLLIEVVKDILAFLAIFFYFTLAFTFMVISLGDSQSYSNFSMISDTYLLNFGSFIISDDSGSLQWLCFVISSLINFLIMVNLLISIIGDTYDKVQSYKAIADRRELAEMILEIEELMIWKRKQQRKHYFHMVCSDSNVQNADVWEGKVRELQNQIIKVENKVSECHDSLSTKFSHLQTNISSLTVKIDKILAKP